MLMTMTPENIPDAPSPATARPMIKALEVGAAPQTAEPISNIPIDVMKTVFAG